MRNRQRRSSWGTLVSGILCSAVLVGALVGFTTHGHPAVKAAAVRRAVVHTVVAPVAAPVVHSVAFIGDSWTAGTGATGRRSYAVLTAEQLGWRSEVLGVGGSGYDVQGHGSVFSDRIDRAVSADPDVIVIQGSINERFSSARSLAPVALATLTRLRATAASHTKILVLGASYVPGVPTGTVNWINATEQKAAATLGLPFVNPAALKWTTPADKGIWFDPLHPNDVGHQIVATHLEALLRRMVAG